MSGSNNFLLDTNIILYLLNGDKVIAGIIGHKTPNISVITEMELLSYAKPTPTYESNVKAFLKSVT